LPRTAIGPAAHALSTAPSRARARAGKEKCGRPEIRPAPPQRRSARASSSSFSYPWALAAPLPLRGGSADARRARTGPTDGRRRDLHCVGCCKRADPAHGVGESHTKKAGWAAATAGECFAQTERDTRTHAMSSGASSRCATKTVQMHKTSLYRSRVIMKHGAKLAATVRRCRTAPRAADGPLRCCTNLFSTMWTRWAGRLTSHALPSGTAR
jgi:hypothetical protein